MIDKKEITQSNIQPTLCDVEYLQLSAGMGKTYTTLKWIVNEELPKGRKWLYVGKGVALVDASESDALSFNPEIITEVIHSKSKHLSTVSASIIDSLSDRESIDIIFITHSSFTALIKEAPHVFSGWSVIIDEMLEVFDTPSYSKDISTDMIKDYLVPIEGSEGIFKLDAPVGVVEGWERDHKYMGVTSFPPFISCLKDGSSVTFKPKGKNRVDYTTHSVLDVTEFMGNAERVIMLGARIENTLHSEFIKRQGIKFVPFTEVTPRCSEYSNQERVTLYYLTSDDRANGCTGGLLDTAFNPKTLVKVSKEEYTKLENGMDSLGEDYLLVHQAYVNKAYELLGEDFIYTVNKVSRWSDQYKPVKYGERDIGILVPYGCHGLNHLKKYTKVLSLFCVKPSPVQIQLFNYLQEELDYPTLIEDYIDEKMREASYQLCLRSKIRETTDTETEIIFVLPDKQTARYIQEHHIPRSIIKDDLVIPVPSNQGGHNRGFAEEYFSGDTAGKKAYHREKSRYKRLHEGASPSVDYLLEWKDKYLTKRELNNK